MVPFLPPRLNQWFEAWNSHLLGVSRADLTVTSFMTMLSVAMKGASPLGESGYVPGRRRVRHGYPHQAFCSLYTVRAEAWEMEIAKLSDP